MKRSGSLTRSFVTVKVSNSSIVSVIRIESRSSVSLVTISFCLEKDIYAAMKSNPSGYSCGS
jgi:hypothetical protein